MLARLKKLLSCMLFLLLQLYKPFPKKKPRRLLAQKVFPTVSHAKHKKTVHAVET